MKKNNTPIRKNKQSIITIIAVLIAVVFSGSICYYLAYRRYHKWWNDAPVKNIVGYVSADDASGFVDGFYQRYVHPTDTRKRSLEESRKFSVDTWGSKNLNFYYDYYQHGFDPIVCSSEMPESVAVASTQPGTNATVNVKATYPDKATANITATVAIDNDGWHIDSVTCPGAKGNLPPQR